ncbi:phosphatidylethanolamine N-methyltransferase isoform X1 [Ursus americanus]|nr:phosphatidylethanolamine N-methyltransferase isoform X1 [Ursus americanus]XP_045634141.1 phosphatidylethanolamine N-methyltransferase isoform X1 [Ursus americanus]XP_045634142.1 phosphatidylethanolamine N-methyltransferase isoform X1 [Ursus americanus]XP_045634143.1 phosphatidylethanolamine N-methyltransferase isoform X1 [Ursus americanus]XP_045634144.1 phosphatidylethanolamine N-methyltransferase isoform X1 [Ursus americanus]
MTWLLGYVDPSDPCFVAAILAITFNPLFWNVVARWEQKTRKLSRAFRSPYLACYSLGAAILLLNVLRSHCFTQAMLSQPKMESLDNPTAYRTGLALLGVGSAFVISSFLALGFTGTFLGDYFGILKEARVTTFPFNVLDNPMYWGSTANYLGWAVICCSPAPWSLGDPRELEKVGPADGRCLPALPAESPRRAHWILHMPLGGTGPISRKQPKDTVRGGQVPCNIVLHASPTGLLLTAVVALVYKVAVLYEEPFTAQIYQQKASPSHKRS